MSAFICIGVVASLNLYNETMSNRFQFKTLAKKFILGIFLKVCLLHRHFQLVLWLIFHGS